MLRRVVSLTLLLSGFLLIVTGAVLYIVPPGRVAYWTDWRLWGFSKTQWGNLHINLGVFLFFASILHVYYNWKPIVSYLKDKVKRIKIFTRAFNYALLISILIIIGTFVEVPPFVWVIEISTAIKDRGIEKYGEPPYGHAELSSIEMFSKKMQLDLGEVVSRLEKASIRINDTKQSLEVIAEINEITPKQIYQAIISFNNADQQNKDEVRMPEYPHPGTGNYTPEGL